MSSGVFVGIDHGGTTTTAPVLDLEKGKRSSHSGPVPKRMLQPGADRTRPGGFLGNDPGLGARRSLLVGNRGRPAKCF